ncbi:rho GTPase-activating protein 31 [Platysternon megacephalum]|uniref:Rho GTPase-activating protein 31 n=1 Tax=Platysternon megacephalum TaxID=55544 RepID=A0A4D9EEC3_9SAUR|nr:rho GTPase-activating protein 31 [Platysternon megacephalum]
MSVDRNASWADLPAAPVKPQWVLLQGLNSISFQQAAESISGGRPVLLGSWRREQWFWEGAQNLAGTCQLWKSLDEVESRVAFSSAQPTPLGLCRWQFWHVPHGAPPPSPL